MNPLAPELRTNPYVAALIQAFQETPVALEYLVIAHTDARLVNAISSALTGHASAILEVPQGRWAFGDSDLSKALKWAVENLAIEHLVLVGSSGGPNAQSRVTLTTNDESAPSGFEKMVLGAQRVQAQAKAAQEWFASKNVELKQQVVQNHFPNGGPEVQGLIYRPESGVFLRYDSESDTYHPPVS